MLNPKLGGIDRRIVTGIAVLAIIFGGLVYFGMSKSQNDHPRPALMMMSSIPLQWGDATMAEITKGETEQSLLFESLAEKNRPILIDDFQKLGSHDSAPLLLIQPRALAPRELVQLDNWVRKGGAVIIFADPVLSWPSERSLGDQRRPLFTSLLNPLFGHWGLQLALPVDDTADAKSTTAGGYALAPKSPGIWVRSKNTKPAAKCVVRDDELIAHCAVGKGRALLIADADLLHDAQWTDGIATAGTIAWLDRVVSAARSKESMTSDLWEITGN